MAAISYEHFNRTIRDIWADIGISARGKRQRMKRRAATVSWWRRKGLNA
jgi:hypothetical protein